MPKKKATEAKVCKVEFCRDPKTGKIFARPDGCAPGEFLEYVKEIKKQSGFSINVDDV